MEKERPADSFLKSTPYSQMHRECSVALTRQLDLALQRHLLREDGQEDLAFGLWYPSKGHRRQTALLHTSLLPKADEREVHGNVSFRPAFLERAAREAVAHGCGIAFMHSHPFPGWQGMSEDDIRAEQRMAGAVLALTGLPLLGLTVGTDGVWSARVWQHVEGRQYERRWCKSVRIVGDGFRAYMAEQVSPRLRHTDSVKRTVSVWGEDAHSVLSRLRVGIVGLGSVGALVAESLARMGLSHFVLIDFDRVESHNLDRLVTAIARDIGRLKVDVASDRIKKVGTAATLDVSSVPFSLIEEEGYRAALDCDVLFSCVDRPRPRSILNHFAYSHLIPVIDGGVQARFKRGRFTGVDWQTQSVLPGNACLECLGAYDSGDVSTEAAGKLDDPSYMAGLPTDHRLRRNENVFPFVANLASLEVLQLIAMVTHVAGVSDFGVQRFRYVPGIMEQTYGRKCKDSCDRASLIGHGDEHFALVGIDEKAHASRASIA
jgi:molybdopterin/thiamine biosynthesis adenylyltransferase